LDLVPDLDVAPHDALELLVGDFFDLATGRRVDDHPDRGLGDRDHEDVGPGGRVGRFDLRGIRTLIGADERLRFVEGATVESPGREAGAGTDGFVADRETRAEPVVGGAPDLVLSRTLEGRARAGDVGATAVDRAGRSFFGEGRPHRL